MASLIPFLKNVGDFLLIENLPQSPYIKTVSLSPEIDLIMYKLCEV